uniref:Ferric oxidoreductase domain-containing protein n=1 Tax=Brassica campestris TaxID=3711 RepID=A0A3P5YKJ0_BRACM|nr:unnamed protein product [Brassica rapa]
MILPLVITLVLLVMIIWLKRNLQRSSRPLTNHQIYIFILFPILLLHTLSHLLDFFLSKRRD